MFPIYFNSDFSNLNPLTLSLPLHLLPFSLFLISPPVVCSSVSPLPPSFVLYILAYSFTVLAVSFTVFLNLFS